jgi:hypothetical protein
MDANRLYDLTRSASIEDQDKGKSELGSFASIHDRNYQKSGVIPITN